MFKNLTILIISPDKWDFLPVSKHHYAIELAKENDVYFINPPNSKKENHSEKGVKIINQYRQIRGINKLPKLLQKFLMKSEVNSIMNQIEGNKADIIWSFDTSRLYHLDLFNAKIKIAHIVDFSEHFNFNELISSADFCFATSDSITEKMIKYHSKVFKINHGYFPISKVEKQKVNQHLNAVYVGNLNAKYLDWNALYIIASNYTSITFDFYGTLNIDTDFSNNEYFNKVYNLKNTIFHGKISPEEVSIVLINATFCFAYYQSIKYYSQWQNPHKIMQYLGSGTPLFSSFTHEFRDLDLFTMYQDGNDILDVFNRFINNEFNDFTDEAKQKRIAFALDNTYEKQIERIKKIIFENGI
jgi:hypothetical protein